MSISLMLPTMSLFKKILRCSVLLLVVVSMSDCKKIDEWTDENPDIEPLRQGFKTSAAIGYCVSLAATVFQGGPVPDNVIFESSGNGEYSNAGILYVSIDEDHPMPFNKRIGDVIIAGIWNNDNYGDGGSGVISIVFGNLNIIGQVYRFYGMHTVPVIRDHETGRLLTVFARQDIVLGEGNDTLLNLSMSNPQFSTEIMRLDEDPPQDVYAAISQNVWFISIDQNDTPNVYDDSFVINGGGQIAEATSSSGGIQYHAMIETEFIYDQCTENPFRGDAFIQNIKAGTGIDLGNIYLKFHDRCDGKAYVELSSGE
ncbi:MAG: hypothetical protein PVF73_02650, partial [Bacteroidales bacterium]